MTSPWELSDEGSAIIQSIIAKLGDQWRAIVGEELAARMEDHIREVSNPAYDTEDDDEDDEAED